jgi:hypothetical protein
MAIRMVRKWGNWMSAEVRLFMSTKVKLPSYYVDSFEGKLVRPAVVAFSGLSSARGRRRDK